MNMHTTRKSLVAKRRQNVKNFFAEKCYKLLAQIPSGKVTTYGEIARSLNTTVFRVVGRAMKNNPKLVRFPYHRVVRGDGGLGGYVHGTEEKKRLLEGEGVVVKDNGKISLAKYFHKIK